MLFGSHKVAVKLPEVPLCSGELFFLQKLGKEANLVQRQLRGRGVRE